ncbi:MAG: RDD family protein [Chloroflexi bacterium]|nr:RDD family protein [Chloroflexota bacterium]
MEHGTRENLRIPGTARRLKALFFDWLLISAYLIVLLIVASSIYALIPDGTPESTSYQAQLIATLASVVPVTAVFAIWEGTRPFASWGKRRVGLKVIYEGSPVRGSVIRNTAKFLPWQFGHMGTIDGVYHGFDTPFAAALLSLSIALAIVYVLMVLLRHDGRHLADLLAGSTVVVDRT